MGRVRHPKQKEFASHSTKRDRRSRNHPLASPSRNVLRMHHMLTDDLKKTNSNMSTVFRRTILASLRILPHDQDLPKFDAIRQCRNVR